MQIKRVKTFVLGVTVAVCGGSSVCAFSPEEAERMVEVQWNTDGRGMVEVQGKADAKGMEETQRNAEAKGMVEIWESAGAAGGSEAVLPAPADSVTLSAAQVADLLIEEAYKHIGTPYRYGARGPKAFDCSGFTSYVYRRFGIALSHSSRDQARDGRAVEGTMPICRRATLSFSERAPAEGASGTWVFS